ncbi:MAG TPA: VCBS repeat-containing protein [Nitrospirae bacterium]|nr:hypothetical protein BMS3Abin10_00602 [bacterium BMS3Abin10]GBE39750.1 hypothetical protein BMS3Bbin08_02381 [bacterium BMS3Bbin08]HDH50916.1 VCBS repeat-containing protein [Nitrospirota bacterium]HDK16471.1 VCBS repeat-containing protein [Nitrospirota bacterium]HDK82096.1 VCBS repeat-containing protein [Nitrospirota bacterium]
MGTYKLYISFAVVSMAIFVLLATAGISAGQQETAGNSAASESGNPVNSLRDSILSYFPPVSGRIVQQAEGFVKVELQTDRELKEGIRLTVFREGEPFYHPVTKEFIGRAEEFIGRVELVETQPKAEEDTKTYQCRIVEGSPVAGDLVRISSSRLKLAFFQDKHAEWALSEAFYSSLKESGRFILLEAYARTNDPGELSRLASELGAEAVLFFSTPVKNKKIFISASLFWPDNAAVFAETEEPVGLDFARELTEGDEIISMGLKEGEPWGSHELSGGELLAMGDVDGNDERELVVSDGHDIRIYNYKQEPQEIWHVKGSPKEQIIAIDVLDLNKNGRAEIFVTVIKTDVDNVDLSDSEIPKSAKADVMSSFVMEYDPKEGYIKIWDRAPYIFRVVGKMLIMQKFTPSRGITGPVRLGVWGKGRYEPGKPLELPEGLNIFGFTFVDWQNSGHPDVLALNDRGYLSLYKKGELIWHSEESYGGFDKSFKNRSYSSAKSGEEWFVKGRLVTVATNRGQEVIVVKRIPFASAVPGAGYKRTEVYSLWWDGGMMEETMLLGGINASVTDYWVEGDNLLLISKLNLFGFFKKILSGEFVKGSILYYFNLTGK